LGGGQRFCGLVDVDLERKAVAVCGDGGDPVGDVDALGGEAEVAVAAVAVAAVWVVSVEAVSETSTAGSASPTARRIS
jgi:hypothetical protein